MKLLLSEQKKFLVKDTSKDFHTRDGTIKSKDFNKSKVKTNKKVEFSILDPQFIDFYEKIKRGAQIISLKDIGAIITETGINKESKVLDAGSGSGIDSLGRKLKSAGPVDAGESTFRSNYSSNRPFLGVGSFRKKK